MEFAAISLKSSNVCLGVSFIWVIHANPIIPTLVCNIPTLGTYCGSFICLYTSNPIPTNAICFSFVKILWSGEVKIIRTDSMIVSCIHFSSVVRSGYSVNAFNIGRSGEVSIVEYTWLIACWRVVCSVLKKSFTSLIRSLWILVIHCAETIFYKS